MMKKVKMILGIILLIILGACSDKNEIKSCECAPEAQTVIVNDCNAKVDIDNETGMYLLTHSIPNSIDALEIYMVDRETDIAKIRALNSDEVIFSGTAMKSTYLPKAHVADAEYYCITLSNVSVK